jgi:hypothetical protein
LLYRIGGQAVEDTYLGAPGFQFTKKLLDSRCICLKLIGGFVTIIL